MPSYGPCLWYHDMTWWPTHVTLGDLAQCDAHPACVDKYTCVVFGVCCQVGGQPAMEAIPLVMEPESRMYTSPVVVLDFQSLYPSQVCVLLTCLW